VAQFPALPLFTDAYLGDTNHLTTLEHGAYLLLLITAWRSNGCRLVNDDKMLARYTRLTPSQWKRIKPIILEFFDVRDGHLIQRRLIDELNTVKRLTNQRSKAGKASALKRKERDTTDVGFPLNEKQAPTPTPTPTKKNIQKKGNRIPEDWTLSDRNFQYAKEKGYPPVSIPLLAETFHNHWLSSAGSTAVKKDWNAAWRKWVAIDISKFGGPQAVPQQKRGLL